MNTEKKVTALERIEQLLHLPNNPELSLLADGEGYRGYLKVRWEDGSTGTYYGSNMTTGAPSTTLDEALDRICNSLTNDIRTKRTRHDNYAKAFEELDQYIIGK